VVHLGQDKKSFRLLEATGSVDVQLTGVPDDKKYRGQSGVAVYDPAKGTLTLTGWPKIQGSGQELVAAEEGTRVVLMPKTGKMHTEGRAQTRVAKRLMEESASAGTP
jgi:lipopolysaccharide export system protein LptA